MDEPALPYPWHHTLSVNAANTVYFSKRYISCLNFRHVMSDATVVIGFVHLWVRVAIGIMTQYFSIPGSEGEPSKSSRLVTVSCS